MGAEIQDQPENHIKMMMIQDLLVAEKDFLKRFQATGEMMKMKNLLLEMRKHQYANRYGDYIKIAPLWYRTNIGLGWPGREVKTRAKYWKYFAKKLQAEANLHESEMRRVYIYGHINQRATAAVRYACSDLGISYSHAVWSIYGYSNINSRAYQNLEEIRKDGTYGNLAKILFFDKAELHKIFSQADSEVDILALEQKIQEEIDTWFHCTEPDDPDTWTPTIACLEVARNERERLRQEAGNDQERQTQLGLVARQGEQIQPNIGKRRAPEREVSTIRNIQMRAARRALQAERDQVTDKLIRLNAEAIRSGLDYFSDDWTFSIDDSELE